MMHTTKTKYKQILSSQLLHWWFLWYRLVDYRLLLWKCHASASRPPTPWPGRRTRSEERWWALRQSSPLRWCERSGRVRTRETLKRSNTYIRLSEDADYNIIVMRVPHQIHSHWSLRSGRMDLFLSQQTSICTQQVKFISSDHISRKNVTSIP